MPLAANEAEMMSAGSLVLIHVKWREETESSEDEDERNVNE